VRDGKEEGAGKGRRRKEAAILSSKRGNISYFNWS
jgi:hypothetical protein